MIERLIENWLDKANERSFQIPFCQALSADGHSILYVSPHGILEQGKDVITRDSEGKLHAYQLKSGSITLSTWRNTVKGEAEALCDLPLRHPSVRQSERLMFDAHLVCSGEIVDSVRNDLDALNEGRRISGRILIQTTTRGELLNIFKNAHERFFPTEPEDFREFLTLYLSNGCENLSKPNLSNFMRKTLDISRKNSTDYKRLLAALAVMVGYLSGEYYRCENNLAIAETWLMYALHVAACATENSLDVAHWIDNYNLAIDGMGLALESLTTEALNSDVLAEGDPLVDGAVYNHRVTLLCGWLSA